jgi:hypothetical protein
VLRVGALAVALVLAVAGCGTAEEPARPGEASVARWSTWVVESPGAIAVPPAPDGHRPAAEPEPEGRPAVVPWIELAMDLVSQRTKDPPESSRAYAYVSVAMADAAVVAAHWQERHGDPGYPSLRAAVAGAAAGVLPSLYPERSPASFEAMARREAGSGAAADAGLALGAAVAADVNERAANDGYERRWSGSVPRGRGLWAPPPGSLARPVQPLAGRWRTWHLSSGRDLRPGPPPAFGSAAFRAEAQEVVDVGRRLSPERKALAAFWAGGEGTPLPAGIWNQILLRYTAREAWDTARTARALALLNTALCDAGTAAWDAKYAYWSPRPENAIRDLGLARDWKPFLDTPFFPAYVSGHATYSGAAGEVLSHLFPEDEALIRAKAREAADSRVWGGIHYRSDGVVGRRMGREIGLRAVRRAERDEVPG